MRSSAVLGLVACLVADAVAASLALGVGALALGLALLVGAVAGGLLYRRRIAPALCTDPLTGLRNRRALARELSRACARASEDEPAYVWFFDLNGFKQYNDSFGHVSGDALLARLGARLGRVAGRHGAGYRLDGDEFCVLITAPVRDPHALFQRARAALGEQGGAFTVTASGGAVELPREASPPLVPSIPLMPRPRRAPTPFSSFAESSLHEPARRERPGNATCLDLLVALKAESLTLIGEVSQCGND